MALVARALTVLLHGTMIDGTGAAPVEDVAIEIRAGRISSIRAADGYSVPAGAVVYDLSGKWILPGLIDAHTHLFDSGSLYTSPDDYDLTAWVPHGDVRREIVARLPETLDRYLCAGVTSVASLGGPRWELEIRRDTDAPRVLTAGPFLANFPVGEMTLWTQDDPVLVHIASPDQARAAANRIAERGVDLIKVGVSGVSGEAVARFHPTLSALVDASHERGLVVAIHAEELAIAKMAIRAGVDVLAHTVNDRLVDDEFLRLARSRDVVNITGLAHFDRYREVLDGRVELLEVEERCGDPDAIATWSELADIPTNMRPAVPAAIEWGSSDEARDVLRENVRRMAEYGITLAAGSNGGNIGTLQGPSYHRELHRLADASIPLSEVVVAATRNAARALGVDGDRGSIARGKRADFVVLERDPLVDVEHFSAVFAVFVAGERIDVPVSVR